MKCWAFDPGYHPFTGCTMQYFWLEQEVGGDDENPPVRACCVVINPPDIVPTEENSWVGVTYGNAGTVYPAYHAGIAPGPALMVLEKEDVRWTVEDVLDELGYELQGGDPPDFPQFPDTTPRWGGTVQSRDDLPEPSPPSHYYWVEGEQRVYAFVYESTDLGSTCVWANAEWTQDLTDYFGFDPRVVPES